MKATALKPEFVEFMPKELQEGILYISERYRTASHLCACGCKTRIVTPLKPTGWSLRKAGAKVSLWPSIGNWDHACRSHYIIRNNKVIWAADMSAQSIRYGRMRDDQRRAAYFRGDSVAPLEEPNSPIGQESIFAVMWSLVKGLFGR
jgi:hypothetical protein